MQVERDRDARGRARNARPRDRLGRPLPHGAAGVAPVVDDPSLSPAQALAAAQELLDAGFPFQAHEVLEAAWKSAPEDQRALWQGLAQLAVGVTHAARGNVRGAVALLERATAAIAAYGDTAPHGIDAVALVGWTRSQLAVLAQSSDGPVDLDPPRLRRS